MVTGSRSNARTTKAGLSRVPRTGGLIKTHKHEQLCGSLYAEVTQRIVAELVAGRCPWVQPWDKVAIAPGLPANASLGCSDRTGISHAEVADLSSGARCRRMCP